MTSVEVELHDTPRDAWLRRWWPSVAAAAALVVVGAVVFTMLGDDGETAPPVRAEGVVNTLDVTVDATGADVRGSLLAGTVSIAVRNTGDGQVWTGIGRLADGIDARGGAGCAGARRERRWGAWPGSWTCRAS